MAKDSVDRQIKRIRDDVAEQLRYMTELGIEGVDFDPSQLSAARPKSTDSEPAQSVQTIDSADPGERHIPEEGEFSVSTPENYRPTKRKRKATRGKNLTGKSSG